MNICSTYYKCIEVSREIKIFRNNFFSTGPENRSLIHRSTYSFQLIDLDRDLDKKQKIDIIYKFAMHGYVKLLYLNP